MSTLRKTLEELTQATNIFATELDEAGYSNYDFTPDNSPYDLSFLSLEGLSAREDLITAAMNILRLARGPQERLTTFAGTTQGVELGTMQALVQMGIPQQVPLNGSISYTQLAASAQISPELLQRLVRLADVAG
ncbi:uncharacterized protein N7473_012795 [Penicillium subrubescens]|uniref:uncharacterized protein n=1 Tax=Penicillium subrubescens TaxID=1316194 RepID=UPI0025456131|nr:uncharacterized protein N7473_012795 [Penicillium subrubescens]KAJ5875448.1 hypothetical protein N7473_012795 [Penicillium subrubescens]